MQKPARSLYHSRRTWPLRTPNSMLRTPLWFLLISRRLKLGGSLFVAQLLGAEVFPWDGRERSSAGVWRYRRGVLRVLLSGGRVEPSLLYFLAAAVWADDRTFLIFCRSQGLRERPGAGVAEKLIVGHG